MAQLTTNLNLITGKKNEVFSLGKNYTEILDVVQEVDNTDGFLTIVSFSGTKGTNTLPSSKGFCIYNQGSVASEIQLKTMGWKDGGSNIDLSNNVDVSGDGASRDRFVTFILPAKEFIYLPHSRFINYANDESAGGGASIENTAPNTNLYTDSGANLSSNLEDSESEIDVDYGLYFKVGDLVQVGINTTTATRQEVMRVTSITDTAGDGAYTPAALGVERALYGTSKADKDSQTDGTNGAVSGANVYFPFFNTTDNSQHYSGLTTAQTDSTGRWHTMNFFGYGRTSDGVADGLTPGSVAIKFYNNGYQELGLSGITPSTETGLTAGTAYQFTIAVDGGSAYDADITVDANNTKFGGPNGLISKINNVFASAYYTSGNLFEKKVSCAIVNGDIRFTSGSRLSTSAISLGDSSGGDTDLWGAGRIPAVANIEGAVASKLPDDTIFDKANYNEVKNAGVFAYDDGNGNIIGAATGVINYETGEINFSGPSEASFVVSVSYAGAHSGGTTTSSNNFNNIQSISARSMNQKINTTIRVLAFN